jgi:hypothetical protein
VRTSGGAATSGAVEPAVASAAFSAVAATASWATIFQNRRERRAAARPDLNVRVMMVPVNSPLLSPNLVDLVVLVDNVGSVAATGVNFMVTFRGAVDHGPVGNAFLFPGQSEGPIPTALQGEAPVDPDETRIIVTCRDRLGVLHAFTHTIKSHSYKPGWLSGPATPSKQVIFADLYPSHVLEGHIDQHTGQAIEGDGLD